MLIFLCFWHLYLYFPKFRVKMNNILFISKIYIFTLIYFRMTMILLYYNYKIHLKFNIVYYYYFRFIIIKLFYLFKFLSIDIFLKNILYCKSKTFKIFIILINKWIYIIYFFVYWTKYYINFVNLLYNYNIVSLFFNIFNGKMIY